MHGSNRCNRGYFGPHSTPHRCRHDGKEVDLSLDVMRTWKEQCNKRSETEGHRGKAIVGTITLRQYYQDSTL